VTPIKKEKIFYGWIIVFASIIVTSVGIGVYASTNTVFIKPICDSLGFSRGEFTLHRTIITLVGAFLMPLYAILLRKFKIKQILLISAVFLSITTFSYSFASQLWHFYVIAAINGLFLNGAHFMIVGVLVSRWFIDKKGFATGLAYCGSGIGGAIMTPIAGQMVESMGWQWSFRALAIIGLTLLLPIVVLLIKESPESIGLKPYRNENRSENKDTQQIDISGITFKQALKNSTFWLLAIAFFFISILASGPMTHTIPFLTDIGYPLAFATSVFSFLMILLTIGKIGLGMVFDRFGALLGSIFVGICCITFPLLAMIASTPVIPWLYAMFFGLATVGFTVPVTVLVTKYFGSKDFATIFSVLSMITTFGSSIAVPFMGIIYDNTDSYDIAWILLFIFAIISTFCLISAYFTSRKLIKKTVTTQTTN